MTSLFFLGFLVALGILKPFEEGFGGLADLAADGEVNISLAGLAAPGCENPLGNEVFLVVGQKDLGDLRDKLRVFIAHETLSATKECLLVLFGSDHLFRWSAKSSEPLL